jgi:hypothetical protein
MTIYRYIAQTKKLNQEKKMYEFRNRKKNRR